MKKGKFFVTIIVFFVLVSTVFAANIDNIIENIVTDIFLEKVAEELVDHYEPGNTADEQGHVSSFKYVFNIVLGEGYDQLEEAPAVNGRKTYNYGLWREKIAEKISNDRNWLFNQYMLNADKLLAYMEKYAKEKELTVAQQKEMFSLYAEEVEKFSKYLSCAILNLEKMQKYQKEIIQLEEESGAVWHKYRIADNLLDEKRSQGIQDEQLSKEISDVRELKKKSDNIDKQIGSKKTEIKDFLVKKKLFDEKVSKWNVIRVFQLVERFRKRNPRSLKSFEKIANNLISRLRLKAI